MSNKLTNNLNKKAINKLDFWFLYSQQNAVIIKVNHLTMQLIGSIVASFIITIHFARCCDCSWFLTWFCSPHTKLFCIKEFPTLEKLNSNGHNKSDFLHCHQQWLQNKSLTNYSVISKEKKPNWAYKMVDCYLLFVTNINSFCVILEQVQSNLPSKLQNVFYRFLVQFKDACANQEASQLWKGLSHNISRNNECISIHTETSIT